MDYNYSVVLGQLITCIDETAKEADTAPLFKIECTCQEWNARGILKWNHSTPWPQVCTCTVQNLKFSEVAILESDMATTRCEF